MVVSLPTTAAKIAAFQDPELRKRLVAEATLPPEIAAAAGRDWESTIVRKVALEKNRGLEGRRLGEVAAERGRTPLEAMIELSVEEGLETWFLRSRIGHSDDAAVGALLAHPHVHVGAGDGGAHVASFATYGDTGYLFSRFVRETKALRLEDAVKKVTFDPCSIWGLAGRGLLRPGQAADVVVFDAAAIDRGPELEARDLPGDGIRWVRHARRRRERARERRVGLLVGGRLHGRAERRHRQLTPRGRSSSSAPCPDRGVAMSSETPS